MNDQVITLSDVITEAKAIAIDAQKLFGHLSATQLNWKPSADQWSVAQCLEHLIATNRAMFPAFEQTINGTKTASLLERLPFLPAFFGKMMVKYIAPGATQKFKAPPIAAPAASGIDPQIVSRFLTHQEDVVDKVQALAPFNPAQVIMTSPFAGFITYSLLDAARIIVLHERRHFAQAQRVMNADGFPAH